MLIRRNHLMTSAAVNNTAAGSSSPMYKKIGIGMAVFAVIEAVVTFFLVMKPLFINPVYAQCREYNDEGKACIVKFFGKTFASDAEIASNQIILSLWDTIVNILLIYLIITGILLVLSFCYFKGFAFAKSYLIAVFGAKALVGLVSIIIPFANFRNSMRIFGAIDAVICIAACAFCVYQSSDEYADDMLLTAENRKSMWKRGIEGAAIFLGMAALAIFTHFAMAAYGSTKMLGGNWSLITGWVGNDTGIAQGVVLMLLLGTALIGSIVYVRDGEWAMIYYFSFGAAAAVANLVAVIVRFVWVAITYTPIKAFYKSGDVSAYTEMWANKGGYNPFAFHGLYDETGMINSDKVANWMAGNSMTVRWWMATVFLILGVIAAAAIAIFAFTKIKHKFTFKITESEKKPAIAVAIGIGSILLSFIITMIAVLMYDKVHFNTGLTLGAMDYMYIIAYGGITLFLAVAMWSGYSFSKLGTVALYVLIASNNFSSIFTVFGERSAKVAASVAAQANAIEQGLAEIPAVYKGNNYIIAGVLFILSVVVCLGIIAVFVVKEVKDFMYQKRYS